MTDLWSEAARDLTEERLSAAHTAARVASVDLWSGVLSSALSRTDFENRLAAIGPNLDSICSTLTNDDPSMFIAVRAAINDSLIVDFEKMHQQRQATRTASYTWERATAGDIKAGDVWRFPEEGQGTSMFQADNASWDNAFGDNPVGRGAGQVSRETLPGGGEGVRIDSKDGDTNLGVYDVNEPVEIARTASRKTADAIPGTEGRDNFAEIHLSCDGQRDPGIESYIDRQGPAQGGLVCIKCSRTIPQGETVNIVNLTRYYADKRAQGKLAGQKSNECPKCGKPVEATQSADGQSLTAKCSSCGWSGTKRKKTAGDYGDEHVREATRGSQTQCSCGWVSNKDSDLPTSVKEWEAHQASALGKKGSRRTASTRYDLAMQVLDQGLYSGEGDSTVKLEGSILDAQTANMLKTVFEALSPENQEKFDSIPLDKLIDFGWRSVGSKKANADLYVGAKVYAPNGDQVEIISGPDEHGDWTIRTSDGTERKYDSNELGIQKDKDSYDRDDAAKKTAASKTRVVPSSQAGYGPGKWVAQVWHEDNKVWGDIGDPVDSKDDAQKKADSHGVTTAGLATGDENWCYSHSGHYVDDYENKKRRLVCDECGKEFEEIPGKVGPGHLPMHEQPSGTSSTASLGFARGFEAGVLSAQQGMRSLASFKDTGIVSEGFRLGVQAHHRIGEFRGVPKTATITPDYAWQHHLVTKRAADDTIPCPKCGDKATFTGPDGWVCRRCGHHLKKTDAARKIAYGVACPICAYYGMIYCRETVGTCDRCHQMADVDMDYSESGDRESPNQTLCLDCLSLPDVHFDAAHKPDVVAEAEAFINRKVTSSKTAGIQEVSAWADGFGNWHARVDTDGSVGNGNEEAAQAAALSRIREELAQREGPGFAPEVVGVVLNHRDSQNGTLTFYYDETNAHEGSRRASVRKTAETMPPGSVSVYVNPAGKGTSKDGRINVRQSWGPTFSQTVYEGYSATEAQAAIDAALEQAHGVPEGKDAKQFGSVTARRRTAAVSPDQLNDLVEFDSPFEVTADGEVNTSLSGVYGPSVSFEGDEDGQMIGEPEMDGSGWEYVNGYSGQDRYSGPVMHSSEYLGGGMARDVLADPGIYVVTSVEDMNDPDNPAGWVLLKKTSAREGSCSLCATAGHKKDCLLWEPPPFGDRRVAYEMSSSIGGDYWGIVSGGDYGDGFNWSVHEELAPEIELSIGHSNTMDEAKAAVRSALQQFGLPGDPDQPTSSGSHTVSGARKTASDRVVIDVGDRMGLPFPASTVADQIISDIISIPSGDKREFVLNGVGFTVYYDEQGAIGDDNRPVRGDVTGDYEVHLGIDGPMGLKRLTDAHVSPGGAQAKSYAARQVADAICNRVRLVTSASVRKTASQVHEFRSTGEAYNRSQSDDSIADGDILSIPSEGVVGFLMSAWPIAVTKEAGDLHTLTDPSQPPKGEPDKTCPGCGGSGKEARPGANSPYRKEGDESCWQCGGKGVFKGDSPEAVALWRSSWNQARQIAQENGWAIAGGSTASKTAGPIDLMNPGAGAGVQKGDRVRWEGDMANVARSGTVDRVDGGWLDITWDEPGPGEQYRRQTRVPAAIVDGPRWARLGSKTAGREEAKQFALDHGASDAAADRFASSVEEREANKPPTVTVDLNTYWQEFGWSQSVGDRTAAGFGKDNPFGAANPMAQPAGGDAPVPESNAAPISEVQPMTSHPRAMPGKGQDSGAPQDPPPAGEPKEQAVARMVAGMRQTNPGMDDDERFRIARATVDRFPSMTQGGSSR